MRDHRFNNSLKAIILFLFLNGALNAQMCMGKHGFSNSDSTNYNYLNPGFAVGLSIMPMPVALGQFYTGDWERGIIYTTAEVAMFIPGMLLLSDGFHHNWNDNDEEEWTDTERQNFYYLLSGYILTKIVSAFDAGYSAEHHNRKFHLGLKLDDAGGAGLALNFTF